MPARKCVRYARLLYVAYTRHTRCDGIVIPHSHSGYCRLFIGEWTTSKIIVHVWMWVGVWAEQQRRRHTKMNAINYIEHLFRYSYSPLRHKKVTTNSIDAKCGNCVCSASHWQTISIGQRWQSIYSHGVPPLPSVYWNKICFFCSFCSFRMDEVRQKGHRFRQFAFSVTRKKMLHMFYHMRIVLPIYLCLFLFTSNALD